MSKVLQPGRGKDRLEPRQSGTEPTKDPFLLKLVFGASVAHFFLDIQRALKCDSN